MAAKQIVAAVVATIFVMTFCSGTMAQAPAPEPTAEAPGPDCFTNLLSLSDCLTYVEAGSNLTKPEKPCCPELAGLVESTPQCLCYLLDKNATSSYGFNIDMNRALNLPTVCKVSTPPVSLCSVIIGAPAESPTGNGGSMSPGFAPQGLAASPSSGNNSGASNIAVSGLASLVALAIAFLPTLFGI
ncbi:PREDICTED: non-specific lipid transfer protein GPI-anchored 2 [Theobroma cacao]|uniref:Non-specific lipid transfer protein GPI-anchored 2 n=1 Tax=Theobroma cacao TaxID=3641 RepID=A0AB32URT5_THECC|nr:PREDICTED: non-specific lipid transfer protein GPI-anchored 2 [Theobroma cacao]